MNRQSGALAIAAAIALAVAIAPARAADADLPLFGIPDLNLKTLFGGSNSAPQPPPPLNLAPPPPPVELAGPPPGTPSPLAGAYVPVPPPGMVTYPGYTAAYPNTGCRGAYWARKPIFNADGLLVGYTRPQYAYRRSTIRDTVRQNRVITAEFT